MANIERRNIRIEDWEGNIYYPETQSGSSLAGRIVDAEDATTDLASTSVTITEGSIVSDSEANNGVVTMIASPTSNKILFQTAISGIPFGEVAVNLRMKFNFNQLSTYKLADIEIYYYDSLENSDGILLDKGNIVKNDIEDINKFIDYSFITDFHGIYKSSACFKIKIIALANNSATLYFDQVAISKNMSAVNHLEIKEDVN